MKEQIYAEIRHSFSRDLFSYNVITMNYFIDVCYLTKENNFIEKYNLDKYIQVPFREVLKREYKDIKKYIGTLDISYKKKYVANYIFSSIVIEVITNIQECFKMYLYLYI